jgi:hypothetical protein
VGAVALSGRDGVGTMIVVDDLADDARADRDRGPSPRGGLGDRSRRGREVAASATAAPEWPGMPAATRVHIVVKGMQQTWNR